MKKIIITTLFIVLSVQLGSADEASLYYGKTSARDYLAGKFIPSRHEHFVNLKTLDIATNNRSHYLRKNTAKALKRMIDAFHREHPEIPFYVVSSTRNFDTQRSIWQAKFTGQRLVGGKKLNKTIPDHYTRSLKILEYSSMPGTSRHHWGTDFDINSLVNSYFEKGDGLILYQWLTKNAKRFNFYQVYTAGREGGYNEEKWHWSYLPESKHYIDEWIKYYGKDTSYFSADAFGGSEYADKLAPYYVTMINEECL